MRAAEPPDEWVAALGGDGAHRDDAVARLHGALVRVARSELHRRHGQLNVSGPELDDLAHQAAADAMLAIMARLDQFRGESRFTTWAYKFVMFEVSAKVGRHFWRTPPISLSAEDWDRLPDRFGFDPAGASERRDFIRAVRRAVDEDLTEHQRRIFVLLVLDGVPLDALAEKLSTSRNAIYKVMFDARRKLRASLVADGYLDDGSVRRP
ncbi:MAG TPA: sigma-70 family RNA polymerase sigma factor [Streptosporangiaceae bacterium]|nr:sigma-70 family RNA polymerase sigma factor [Streptosporangiaceae bacterium]